MSFPIRPARPGSPPSRAARPRGGAAAGRLVLLQLVRDPREGGVELAAERGYGADRGDGDEGRDEAILDGGRAGLVLDETLEKGLHGQPPGDVIGCRPSRSTGTAAPYARKVAIGLIPTSADQNPLAQSR